MFANIAIIEDAKHEWCFQIPHSYGLRKEVVEHPRTLRIRLTATTDNAGPDSCYLRASLLANASGFEITAE
jgi:hypothetical protein